VRLAEDKGFRGFCVLCEGGSLFLLWFGVPLNGFSLVV